MKHYIILFYILNKEKISGFFVTAKERILNKESKLLSVFIEFVLPV